ncbi:hypothetical protein [Ascidiimonas sp. W6]|uniref:hypothetical protein n=1 Tax=Ascidiimonas meishanensis TaxID=3128903 RepID=UPI0030EEDFDB
MKTYAETIQENKSPSVTNRNATKGNNSQSTHQCEPKLASFIRILKEKINPVISLLLHWWWLY